MTRASGTALQVAPGQMAILSSTPGGTISVSGVVVDSAAATAAKVDLKTGDLVVALGDVRELGFDSFLAAYASIPVGGEVALTIVRTGAERVVKYAKPARPAGQQTIAVSGGRGAGAGGWVTGVSSGGVAFSIAGSQFVENKEGLPSVSVRTSHPAAATVALRVGDVVTAFDGRPINALAGLQLFYERVVAGTVIKLTVRRGTETVDVAFAKPADK